MYLYIYDNNPVWYSPVTFGGDMNVFYRFLISRLLWKTRVKIDRISRDDCVDARLT